MLNKLIYINVGIFLIFSILAVAAFMFQLNTESTLNKLFLPANNNTLLNQPWALITYMFIHVDFLHLLFNMVWLHFCGTIFLKYLHPRQLLNIYILGGISGGLLFILAYNYVPVLQQFSNNAFALGASASVLAIVVSIATYTPNYNILLPFIGNVRLKHIAIICVILDILSIPNSNTGGHIAHLGGAICGFIYIKQLTKRNELLSTFSKTLKKLLNIFNTNTKINKKHKRSKTDYEFNKERVQQQKEIDIILDKISKSGYESLNKKEKTTLFNASKK